MEPLKMDEPASNNRRIRHLLTFIAIFFVLSGQILLIGTPLDDKTQIRVILVLTLTGICLFLGAQIVPHTRIERSLSTRLSIPISIIWLTPAFLFSLLATVGMYLFEKKAYPNFIPIQIIWLTGAGCYLMALSSSVKLPGNWRKWVTTHRGELLGIGFIMLLTVILRFYKLGFIPKVLNGDEGWIGNTAQSATRLPLANPFALWANIGTLYLQAINFLFGVFGVNAFSLRLLPAIGGCLAIPAVYLLGRQIANHRVGLIAAALMAFSHTHIHFSRTVAVGYIHSTWLVPFELYFLLSGLEKRSLWRAAAGGMLLGFHYSIYLTAQVITVLALVYLLIVAIPYRKHLKTVLRTALAFYGGFLVVVMPNLLYIAGHKNEFMARMNIDGTFQSGWLKSAMELTGHSAVRVLIERVAHAFMSLIYYPAFDFYGSTMPMLSVIASALFLFGLGIALWKTYQQGYLMLNGYFWSITLAVGIFSIPPSADSYRMLAALPAALILASLALDHLLTALGIGWEHWKKGYSVIVFLLLTGMFVLNVWGYFFDFAKGCRYGTDNPQARFDSYLGRFLGNAPMSGAVYLLSDDNFKYGNNPVVDFQSRYRYIINFPNAVDTLELITGDIVIANPNRVEELASWIRTHPGGDAYIEMDCGLEIMSTYKMP